MSMAPHEILNRLSRKTKKIDIEGIEIEVNGLTFPELAHAAPHIDRGNTEYVLNYMVKKTIEKAFPDWSESQVKEFVDNVDPKHILKIVEIVKDLSIPGDESKKNSEGEETPQ